MSDAYARWFEAFSAAPTDLCEDCGQFSDLGRKCRACYRTWSRALWADVPDALRILGDVVADLRAMPQSDAHAVASQFGDVPARVGVKARAADVRMRCATVLEGPFGANLAEILKGFRARGPGKGQED